MLIRALLVIDKPGLQKRVRGILKDNDVIVESIRGKNRMWERLSRESGDLVIVSRSLIPEPVSDTIRIFRDSPESPDIIVIVETEDPDDQAHLIAAGCEVVIQEKLRSEMIGEVIAAVIEKRREVLGKELIASRYNGEPRLSDFVSSSPAMQAFMNVVERIVTSDSSLLIMGETGVGKERLARAIHAEGRRSEGPFIAVNCGALPESLLESELFGHEEGAFTGATRSRRGWFELAHDGTVFLDEIGEIPSHLQVKLLRVLQDHAFQQVGSETTIHVNVRVMASTNRDLALEVENGNFRRDLYYRLNVISLTIPPLRDRREDIPSLVDNYIDYFQNNIGRDVGGITQDAVDVLVQYDWPGNVRELMNVIERAALLFEGAKIDLEDLPEEITRAGLAHDAYRKSLISFSPNRMVLPEELLDKPLREVRMQAVGEVEKAYLTAQLHRTGGRVGETAKKTGIEPRSLYEKMKRYGLAKEDFKPYIPSK